MSNAVAGITGAMVTLRVTAILGALAFFILQRRRATHIAPATTQATNENRSTHSDSESASGVEMRVIFLTRVDP